MAHATRVGDAVRRMEAERVGVVRGLQDLDAQAVRWYEAGVQARSIGAVCTVAECDEQLSGIGVRRARLVGRLDLLRVRIEREKELRLMREGS